MLTIEGTTMHSWCRIKDESPMVQTCRSIDVETYLNVYGHHDSNNQYAQHKLKIAYKTWQQKHSDKHFWRKKIGYPWCSTLEDISIDVSITNVGLILTKLRWFLFSGCGQIGRRTDRHDFGILTWKHAGKHKISTQGSKLVVSCRSLCASPDDGDAILKFRSFSAMTSSNCHNWWYWKHKTFTACIYKLILCIGIAIYYMNNKDDFKFIWI